MRRIYTCLLELADPASAAPRVARALTKRWVGREYGGWPEHAPEHWRPEPGVTVRWRLLDHPATGRRGVRARLDPPARAGPDVVAAGDRADHDDGRRGAGADPGAARVRGPEGAGGAGAAGPPAGARRGARARGRVRRRRLGRHRERRTGSTRHAPLTSTCSCAGIGGCRSCSSRRIARSRAGRRAAVRRRPGCARARRRVDRSGGGRGVGRRAGERSRRDRGRRATPLAVVAVVRPTGSPSVVARRGSVGARRPAGPRRGDPLGPRARRRDVAGRGRSARRAPGPQPGHRRPAGAPHRAGEPAHCSARRPRRGRRADHRVPGRAQSGRRAGVPARGGPRARARAAAPVRAGLPDAGDRWCRSRVARDRRRRDRRTGTSARSCAGPRRCARTS